MIEIMAKILSIDDSHTIRQMVKGAVDVLGYEFIEAENGEEGIDMVLKNLEDLVLVVMDWEMPILNGLDATLQLKANDQTKDIPILMLTTVNQPEKIIQAIKAGAQNYIMKPFTQEELMSKILEVAAS